MASVFKRIRENNKEIIFFQNERRGSLSAFFNFQLFHKNTLKLDNFYFRINSGPKKT